MKDRLGECVRKEGVNYIDKCEQVTGLAAAQQIRLYVYSNSSCTCRNSSGNSRNSRGSCRNSSSNCKAAAVEA